MYAVRDPNYTMGAVETFALQMKRYFDDLVSQVAVSVPDSDLTYQGILDGDEISSDEGVDFIESCKLHAIEQLRENTQVINKIDSPKGMPWGGVVAILSGYLPDVLADKGDIAYHLVRQAMDEIFGEQGVDWHTFKNENNKTVITTHRQ
jgi:hypothetical protein